MTYLITGSTGLIGKNIVKYLINNAKESLNLICIVRSIDKANKIYANLLKNKEYIKLDYIECSIENIIPEEIVKKYSIDYIIHCAAPTQSSFMVTCPVETADSIVIGSKNLLEIAHLADVKSMVYLSSMEVYGIVGDSVIRHTEENLGYLDLFSARSCYPIAKRMVEHYCYIYWKEYNVPVKIARLSQVFGTGVDENDNRVFMQFAKSVINNNNIVLKTKGKSYGNYCSSEDAVNAIFIILEKGMNGEVYNVANEENTMRIIEMAECVADKLANNKIKVEIQENLTASNCYAPDTGLRLSSQKLSKLGWEAKKNISDMYMDVINELK